MEFEENNEEFEGKTQGIFNSGVFLSRIFCLFG
jgi:hypothetical protein